MGGDRGKLWSTRKACCPNRRDMLSAPKAPHMIAWGNSRQTTIPLKQSLLPIVVLIFLDKDRDDDPDKDGG
jgi:hypothetical protein